MEYRYMIVVVKIWLIQDDDMCPSLSTFRGKSYPLNSMLFPTSSRSSPLWGFLHSEEQLRTKQL